MISTGIARRRVLLAAAGFGALTVAGCAKSDGQAKKAPDGKTEPLRFSIVAPESASSHIRASP